MPSSTEDREATTLHAATSSGNASTSEEPSLVALDTTTSNGSSFDHHRPGLGSRSSSAMYLFDRPGTLSRSPSWSGSIISQDGDELDAIPPLDRLTVFDFLENLALPQRLEALQHSLATRTDKVRRQQQKLRDSSKLAREKVVDEWRKRVPTNDENLERYRRRMRDSVDRFGRRWNNAQAITTREKVSFIAGVLNIFISGYLIGEMPEWFHVWYTAQWAYFYPIRFYTYRKRGYHYFLADLCYFVNFLLLLSIWGFPRSKRLFISTFCLAFGNNAVAIAMWRNSLVFHSLDKITSLFIHIMPCVTLHCLVHLVPESVQATRFPAIHHIKTSSPSSPEHYSLANMIVWATVPYLVWQLSYHTLITMRRREKIAAGRPTSFTWLRKSFGTTWLGRIVLSLPDNLQEPAFMAIQYSYALLTMIPAPIWFWSRWASASYLMAMFTWSIYNGATYYIDVFGTRFQKELEKLKAEVAKGYMSPEIHARTPLATPRAGAGEGAAAMGDLSLGRSATDERTEAQENGEGNGNGNEELDDGLQIRQRKKGDGAAVDKAATNALAASA